jgi:hypothetical protein
MYNGVIRVGDVFIWEPYDSDGWPKAMARVRVERIRYSYPDMPEMEEVDHIDPADGWENDVGFTCHIWAVDLGHKQPAWNDISRFREACVKEA